MLSRQDWVEVRGAAAGGASRPRATKAQSPPPNFFEKLIAVNAFSRHFRHFLVTFKECVIPSKQWERAEGGGYVPANIGGTYYNKLP